MTCLPAMWPNGGQPKSECACTVCCMPCVVLAEVSLVHIVFSSVVLFGTVTPVGPVGPVLHQYGSSSV